MFVARVIDHGDVFLETKGETYDIAKENLIQDWIDFIREGVDFDATDEKILADINKDLEEWKDFLYIEVTKI